MNQLSIDEKWGAIFARAVQALVPDLPEETNRCARRIAPSVERLSNQLARTREVSGAPYLDSPEYLLAYLSYYLPVNFYKSRRLLSHLFTLGWKPNGYPLKVTDFGCGPGTQLWALLSVLTENPPGVSRPSSVVYRGIDFSHQALRALSGIEQLVRSDSLVSSKLDLNLTLVHRSARHRSSLPPSDQDLIFVCNILNELSDNAGDAMPQKASWLESLLDRLAEGGVLVVIEPALQSTTTALGQLRNRLLESTEIEILSPCTHRQPCPLVGGDTPRNQWCHQEISWERTAPIRALDGITHLNKERIAFSHLILAKCRTRKNCGPDSFRALSPPLKSRGVSVVHLCGSMGFCTAQLLKRDRSLTNALFQEIRRGDLVRFIAPPHPSNLLRLGKETFVEVEPLE